MKDIAKLSNVSITTVSNLLPYLSVNTSYLPEVLCIDEFKGNAGNFKYQVSLMDGKKLLILLNVDIKFIFLVILINFL